jgi:hypothetical protein
MFIIIKNENTFFLRALIDDERPLHINILKNLWFGSLALLKTKKPQKKLIQRLRQRKKGRGL